MSLFFVCVHTQLQICFLNYLLSGLSLCIKFFKQKEQEKACKKAKRERKRKKEKAERAENKQKEQVVVLCFQNKIDYIDLHTYALRHHIFVCLHFQTSELGGNTGVNVIQSVLFSLLLQLKRIFSVASFFLCTQLEMCKELKMHAFGIRTFRN